MLKDDRNEDQQFSHDVLVGGRDSFMSGWGEAEGGSSYAFWACQPSDQQAVGAWVEARDDIESRGAIDESELPALGDCDHCHIYIVGDGHPALNQQPA